MADVGVDVERLTLALTRGTLDVTETMGSPGEVVGIEVGMMIRRVETPVGEL